MSDQDYTRGFNEAWNKAQEQVDSTSAEVGRQATEIDRLRAEGLDWRVEREDIEAERNRLQALVAQQSSLLVRAEGAVTIGRPHRPKLADEIVLILRDPDGQAAEQWHLAKVEEARSAGVRSASSLQQLASQRIVGGQP